MPNSKSTEQTQNPPQKPTSLFADKAFAYQNENPSNPSDNHIDSGSGSHSSNHSGNHSSADTVNTDADASYTSYATDKTRVTTSKNTTSDTTSNPDFIAKKIITSAATPLKLAVVGHTNTGKTSLLRTLLRDMYFGEVKNEAATTRHVEQAIINDSITGAPLIALYDTPGLEDASGLMDWLEDNTASRRDGIERLQQFLASPVASSEAANIHPMEDYSQEAKVIRQLLASDMAIYVIDAREPALGKYKDELAILSWAAIPVMPVFNFTNSKHANSKEWQTMLARRNLHISTRFDSVAFEFEDEMTLWQNLATMLTHPDVLDTMIQRRREQWAQLYDEANIIIAHFLLNVAAFVREIAEDDDPLPVLNEMQEAVRQTERAMQSELLNLYKFYDNTAVATPLELSEYQQDPFDPELLKSYGIRTTSGAAAGALLGLGIDAAALGTTMGLGAALGGLAGGLLSNTSSIADKISGVKRLYIDPATLTLLATRAADLLAALRHRGHAADPNSPITELQEVSTAPWDANKLPSELKKARSKPHFSSLNQGINNDAQAFELRSDDAWRLADKLRRLN